MKSTILYAMAAMMSSLDPSSPNFQENTKRRKLGDISKVNTPGNFKKCPKGAQEFTFYYTKDEVEYEYKCYARTIDNAREKFVKFLKVNSYKQ